ncbi:MAG: type II toxin-antitoxin system RatA family toxin [Parvibaculales bacterium]
MDDKSVKFSRTLSYTSEQMFSLVADIDSYSDFLPFCNISNVQKREQKAEGEWLEAILGISYKFIKEQYTSRILLDKKNMQIKVEQISGPLKYLYNFWNFSDVEEGCEISCEICFSFKSRFLAMILEPFLMKAGEMMINAFEKRAMEFYDSN